MSRYTCKQLGVCQARIGCSECAKVDYSFAPGTIDTAPTPMHRRKSARRVMCAVLALLLGALCAALAWGYL